MIISFSRCTCMDRSVAVKLFSIFYTAHHFTSSGDLGITPQALVTQMITSDKNMEYFISWYARVHGIEIRFTRLEDLCEVMEIIEGPSLTKFLLEHA